MITKDLPVQNLNEEVSQLQAQGIKILNNYIKYNCMSLHSYFSSNIAHDLIHDVDITDPEVVYFKYIYFNHSKLAVVTIVTTDCSSKVHTKERIYFIIDSQNHTSQVDTILVSELFLQIHYNCLLLLLHHYTIRPRVWLCVLDRYDHE